MKGLAALLAVAAMGAAGAGVSTHLAPVPRTSGPLVQEAYVWQRAWPAELRAAVRTPPGPISGLIVLGAEISWAPREANCGDVKRGHVEWAQVDWDAIGGDAGRVGAAIRVGNHSGPFGADQPTTRLLRETAVDLLRRARAGGVELAEIQVDFDCAEARLDGYRIWVEEVRAAVAPVPVTITALPAWLDRWAFGRLARSTHGYVLQVHSLTPPQGPDRISPLCDPGRAREWVERAARIGVPFRVALPTYGYLLAFSPAGKLLGISAEGAPRVWPEGTVVSDLRADAAAMAGLVRGWRADRPEALDGLVWFRLPVVGDELNWTRATFDRVLRGATPHAALHVEVRYPQPGLAEVFLVNSGDVGAETRVDVELRWANARLLAADALYGFEWRRGKGCHAWLRGVEEIGTERIPPGARRALGWLRFEEATDVEAVLD